MANPSTRQELIDYCLRRLGHPVIDINVDEDQIDDRIDEALQYFHDYHFDGVEKIYMKHQMTQADFDRGWVPVPPPVIFVTGIFPFDDSNSSLNMFDLRYQLRLHDLYDFTSVSYVSYEITMQHIRTLNLLFSGTPQVRFNRHLDKLFLDIDLKRDLDVGEYIVIECYRKLDPDLFTASGTVTVSDTSKVVTGSGTNFSGQLIIGDFVDIAGESKRIVSIESPTQLTVDTVFATSGSGKTITKAGVSDVWNDRFLKRYATALIKLQWGNNLSKFAGIQMPGGVTLDGVRIMQEAQTEIDKIEQEMEIYNVLPSEIMMG